MVMVVVIFVQHYYQPPSFLTSWANCLPYLYPYDNRLFYIWLSFYLHLSKYISVVSPGNGPTPSKEEDYYTIFVLFGCSSQCIQLARRNQKIKIAPSNLRFVLSTLLQTLVWSTRPPVQFFRRFPQFFHPMFEVWRTASIPTLLLAATETPVSSQLCKHSLFPTFRINSFNLTSIF